MSRTGHIVVTGGGSGAGAAIAQALAAAGWSVTIMGRREDPLARQGLAYRVCDVTDAQAVGAAFDAARGERGPVTGVIANAGAVRSAPFASLSPSDLQTMLAVNLGGVFNAFQAGLPDMMAAGAGRLIAVASTAGLKGYPYVTAYCAAKHGVVGLVRSLALETARSGITVNALCPGFLDTPMTEASIARISETTGRDAEAARASLVAANPQKRLIAPEEVASAALWLLSEAASGVNGHALALSGGEI